MLTYIITVKSYMDHESIQRLTQRLNTDINKGVVIIDQNITSVTAVYTNNKGETEIKQITNVSD